MRTAVFASVLTLVICAYAQAHQSSVTALVLRAARHRNYQVTAGSNPSDVPLLPEVYAYDIAVHINCMVVSGLYESQFNELPSAIYPNSRVPVRIGKHSMHFTLPGYSDFTVPIVKRRADRNAACAAPRQSSAQSRLRTVTVYR